MSSCHAKRLHTLLFGACLWLAPQLLPAAATATEPPFTAKVSRLIGLYQAVPVGDRLPTGLDATPGTLDPLMESRFRTRLEGRPAGVRFYSLYQQDLAERQRCGQQQATTLD